MIVDGDADAVLAAEFVEHFHWRFVRLGHDGLDAHVLGKIEDFAAVRLVFGQIANAVIDQFHAAFRPISA